MSYPIVVDIEYIRNLECSLRNVANNLHQANCDNYNLGLSYTLDVNLNLIKNMYDGLSKITNDPKKFALQSSTYSSKIGSNEPKNT